MSSGMRINKKNKGADGATARTAGARYQEEENSL
jgi:hypothetical protein